MTALCHTFMINFRLPFDFYFFLSFNIIEEKMRYIISTKVSIEHPRNNPAIPEKTIET